MIFGELSQNEGGDRINLLQGTRYFSKPCRVHNPQNSYIDTDDFAVITLYKTFLSYFSYYDNLEPGKYTMSLYAKSDSPQTLELKTECNEEEHSYHAYVSSKDWEKITVVFDVTEISRTNPTNIVLLTRSSVDPILIKKVCLYKGVHVDPIRSPSIYELPSVSDLNVSGRNLILGSYRNRDATLFNGSGSLEKGSKSIKFTYDNTRASGILVPISNDYDKYDGIYTLSFLYKSTNDIINPIFYFFTKNDAHILFDHQSNINTAESWTKYVSIIDTRKENISEGTRVLIAYGVNAGTILEIKTGSLKLEPGVIATDWSPAIEDVRNATVEGFGEKLLVNVNLNFITDNGIYQLNGGISNHPGWDIGGLIVFTYYNSTRQFSWDAASNVVKTRVCHDDTWTDWKEMTVS